MQSSEPDSQLNSDEFSRIFDEYRTRIEEITRQAEHELTRLQPSPTAPDADSKSDSGKHNIDTTIDNIITGTAGIKESERILAEARKQAKKILDEAEDRAQKEAKKKTQAQVDKILEQAQQQADNLVAETRRIIQKERDVAMAITKTQMKKILSDITVQARKETVQKSSQIIEDAHQRAEKIMADVTAKSDKINLLINNVVENIRQSVNEVENKLHQQWSEFSQAIADTHSEMEEIIKQVQITIEIPQEPVQNTQADTTFILYVMGERTNGNNGTEPEFRGQIEVRSDSQVDYTYFKNLKTYLLKIPGVKHLRETVSENGLSSLFDMTEPVPLLDVLGKMPDVEQLENATDKEIRLVFKRVLQN